MARFEYRYVKASTGRTNKASATAYDEAQLVAQMLEKGVEVFDVVQLPAEPATERQLAYLSDLGVKTSGALDIREASDLISNAKSRRSPADARGRDLADRYQVETTRFTSKEDIYRSIVAETLQVERYGQLAEWFVFRVYRSRREHALGPVHVAPTDSRFASAAKSLVADPQALRSLLSAARSTPNGFRWFGTYKGYSGDSDRTAAFKLAMSELVSCGLLQKPSAPAPRSERLYEATSYQSLPIPLEARKGCALTFAIGVVFSAGLFSLLFELST